MVYGLAEFRRGCSPCSSVFTRKNDGAGHFRGELMRCERLRSEGFGSASFSDGLLLEMNWRRLMSMAVREETSGSFRDDDGMSGGRLLRHMREARTGFVGVSRV